ncbi:MAG: tyrosine-type recombinase/integrase [Paludibacteraceae bacterium]|nr:tyrosine-type recombinase/integrase [Paludibacteraceae bacterium]
MIRKFLDYITIERHYSMLTVRAYEQDLNEFCSYLHVDPTDLDPNIVSEADIKDWMISLLDAGEKPRTVRRKLSSLRSFWRFLLRVSYVDKDVTRAIIAPKMDKPLPVFFKESEMADAQAAMAWSDDFESVRDSLVIDMLYQTGMREAEIVGLCDGDVDLQHKEVRVFGKRRKERIVPFGDALAERIQAYQTMRNEQFGLVTAPTQPLIVNKKGGKATVDTIYTIVRARMGEVSTLKKHSPHVLRHTFATEMLNNGADINTIKTLLGHSSLAATQVYTHTTFEQLKAAYQQAHPRAKES